MIQLGGKYCITLNSVLVMLLVRLNKTCLNEIYSKIHICKHLSDAFSVMSDEGGALSLLLFSFALDSFFPDGIF